MLARLSQCYTKILDAGSRCLHRFDHGSLSKFDLDRDSPCDYYTPSQLAGVKVMNGHSNVTELRSIHLVRPFLVAAAAAVLVEHSWVLA